MRSIKPRISGINFLLSAGLQSAVFLIACEPAQPPTASQREIKGDGGQGNNSGGNETNQATPISRHLTKLDQETQQEMPATAAAVAVRKIDVSNGQMAILASGSISMGKNAFLSLPDSAPGTYFLLDFMGDQAGTGSDLLKTALYSPGDAGKEVFMQEIGLEHFIAGSLFTILNEDPGFGTAVGADPMILPEIADLGRKIAAAMQNGEHRGLKADIKLLRAVARKYIERRLKVGDDKHEPASGPEPASAMPPETMTKEGPEQVIDALPEALLVSGEGEVPAQLLPGPEEVLSKKDEVQAPEPEEAAAAAGQALPPPATVSTDDLLYDQQGELLPSEENAEILVELPTNEEEAKEPGGESSFTGDDPGLGAEDAGGDHRPGPGQEAVPAAEGIEVALDQTSQESPDASQLPDLEDLIGQETEDPIAADAQPDVSSGGNDTDDPGASEEEALDAPPGPAPAADHIQDAGVDEDIDTEAGADQPGEESQDWENEETDEEEAEGELQDETIDVDQVDIKSNKEKEKVKKKKKDKTKGTAKDPKAKENPDKEKPAKDGPGKDGDGGGPKEKKKKEGALAAANASQDDGAIRISLPLLKRGVVKEPSGCNLASKQIRAAKRPVAGEGGRLLFECESTVMERLDATRVAVRFLAKDSYRKRQDILTLSATGKGKENDRELMRLSLKGKQLFAVLSVKDSSGGGKYRRIRLSAAKAIQFEHIHTAVVVINGNLAKIILDGSEVARQKIENSEPDGFKGLTIRIGAGKEADAFPFQGETFDALLKLIMKSN